MAHNPKTTKSAITLLTGKPPKGFQAGEPSVEVRVTRSYYPKMEAPRSARSVKAYKPKPLDVRIVSVKKGVKNRG